jgi:DNA-binding LacI/PurR family transcriptional regulator
MGGGRSRARSRWSAYHRALDQRGGAFDFDCLLCSTDEGAVVALSWLKERGLRVPEQVAVIGFNNAMFSPWLTPALASVDRRDEAVAGAIERMVFERLTDGAQGGRRERIAMKLVARASAGGAESRIKNEALGIFE